ncbi:peptidylprolyl isomerase [bacterium]|nr:peptidylprolyl isomerase [bacterium]
MARAWGPDGESPKSEISATASWESGEEGFVYSLAYEGAQTYSLSCPWEAQEDFLVGKLDEACQLRISHPDNDTPETVGTPEQREDAYFPFHLLTRSFQDDQGVWRMREGSQHIDWVQGDGAEQPTMRRQRYYGAFQPGSKTLPIRSGRVTTRMDVGSPGPEGVRWMPFVTSEMAFHVGDAALPPLSSAQRPNPELLIRTSQGEMLVELFMNETPLLAGNILALVRSGYYSGTICHRVVEGFVNQCGDPTGTGWGGPSYSIPDTFSPENRHDPFVLSMANAGPDTNGSQWFIPVERTERVENLDTKHGVFGKLVWGEEVALAINGMEVSEGDRPKSPQFILEIREVAPWIAPSEPLPALVSDLRFLQTEGAFVWGSRTLGTAVGRAVWDGETRSLQLEGTLEHGENLGQPVGISLYLEGGFSLATLGGKLEIETPSPTEGNWPGSWVWEGEIWRLLAWPGSDDETIANLQVQVRDGKGGEWLYGMGAVVYNETE